MSPRSPLLSRLRLSLFTAGLLVFFCFLYPTWNASAKMDISKRQASTVMLEPVSKLVSHTRKFLLGRLESTLLKERLQQICLGKSVSVFCGSKGGPATPEREGRQG